MKSKFTALFIPLFIMLIGGNRFLPKPRSIDNTSKVVEALRLLGDSDLPPKPKSDLQGVSAEVGKALVHRGKAKKPGGGKTDMQSNHFVCTACHNTVAEDPDLSVVDPQARLLYARDNELPYLPATTLYGAINRKTYYNGDYEKKYGDLVKPARNNIREAIQLCAVECSQGDKLEEWELESVLAYLWTIDLRIQDLDLSEQEIDRINTAINGNGDQQTAIELIKSKYLSGAPATFVDPPEDREAGLGLVGNPENGKLIYELSCLHCHEGSRYAFFELDDSWFSFRFLEKHFPKYTRYSVYQVTRYGTQPLPGKRAYMPNYTLEKMSNQQLEDLKAYIYQSAD